MTRGLLAIIAVLLQTASILSEGNVLYLNLALLALWTSLVLETYKFNG